jgi:exopolysaccharide biosynthesis polyprenyl glycosylphosphotransferase
MNTLRVPADESLVQGPDQEAVQDIQRRRTIGLRKDRGWLMRRMLLASDVAGLALSFGLAQGFYSMRTNSSGGEAWEDVALFVLSLPLWIVAAKLYGLYEHDDQRAHHSTADDVVGVFHLVTVGTWLLFAGAHVIGLDHPQLSKVLTFWALAIVSVPLLRSGARALCRRSIHYLQNTAIVGAGDVGQEIARKLLKHPEYGINLVGFFDDDAKERADDVGHVALLGSLDDVRTVVPLLDIERVIVAFPNDDHAPGVALVRELNQLGVQVDVVPRFYEVVSPAIDVHAVEGLPLMGLRRPHLSRSDAFLKRSFDVFGAVAGLLLTAPLLALAAIAIKLDSRGPVLFQQIRMGRRARTFRILKLRTMVEDAEARKADVAHLNRHAQDGGDPRMFKIDDDPRVTRVGRWLRRASVDELPQLWNVLRGEMSIVGPRPLILDEHACVSDWGTRRLDLRPGITGLWQVLGRDAIPFGEMVRLDYVYVTSWSLMSDLKLVLRTIPAVFRERRAY